MKEKNTRTNFQAWFEKDCEIKKKRIKKGGMDGGGVWIDKTSGRSSIKFNTNM